MRALAVLYYSGIVADTNENALDGDDECRFWYPKIDDILEGTWGQGRDVCSPDRHYLILTLAQAEGYNSV
jgi:hypothetical protein